MKGSWIFVIFGMGNSGWSDFWKDQHDAFTNIMKINTAFFGKKLKDYIPLNTQTEILDYGCGPGLLIDILAPSGVRFTGADINKFFLDRCKANHPTAAFYQISADPSITKVVFEQNIAPKRFDGIVLLSILQYFTDEKEIELVIKLLRPYLKQGGKIILADIVTENTSSIRDACSLLIASIRQLKIIEFVRFILYLLFSPYRKLSGENKLLVLSDHIVKQIAANTDLKFSIANGMTIHSSRTSYILSVD